MHLGHKLYSAFLENDETILYTIRTHPKLFFKELVQTAVIFILPAFYLNQVFPNLKLIWQLSMLVGIVKIVAQSALWYFNAFLTTNASFVHIDYAGFFNHAITRIDFNQVESINYEVRGITSTLLNKGDILLTKLSGNIEVIKNVYAPKRKVRHLTELYESLCNQQLQKQHANLKDILTNMLQDHITENGIEITKD